MGHVHVLDLKDEHEGWVAMTYADGKISSGTSTSEGHYLDGYTYLPHDDTDTRTWGVIDPAYLRRWQEVTGWVPRCGCGWMGVMCPVPENESGIPCPPKYGDPSDFEDNLIMGQWRLHLREVLPGAYATSGQDSAA